MSLPLRFIIILAGIFNFQLCQWHRFANGQELYICVWRNPERTMSKIFPDAFDYKTVTIKIPDEKRKVIEKRLGSKLLPGQREVFSYYELYNEEKRLIGYILAANQKGEYGAIEFVFGLDKELKIKSIYIQRAREREQEFKKKEFLNQFKGIGIKDEGKLEKKILARKTSGTQAVITGVRKELVAFEELVVKSNK